MKRKLASLIVRTRLVWAVLLLCLSALAVHSLSNTRVNYDLTTYLAENTETKCGLTLMNGEFSPISGLNVVLIDADEQTANAHATRIAAMEGVMTAIHDTEAGFVQRDGHDYRLITVNANADQGEAVLDAVEAQLGQTPHLINGGVLYVHRGVHRAEYGHQYRIRDHLLYYVRGGRHIAAGPGHGLFHHADELL